MEHRGRARDSIHPMMVKVRINVRLLILLSRGVIIGRDVLNSSLMIMNRIIYTSIVPCRFVEKTRVKRDLM